MKSKYYIKEILSVGHKCIPSYLLMAIDIKYSNTARHDASRRKRKNSEINISEFFINHLRQVALRNLP